MKQNNIFKIISSLMVLLTIMSMVNATTISNSLSTFTGIIDMGTNQIYNITNVNTTNLYASVVNTTNLWIGTTKVNASNLLPLACANNTVGKYDTATGAWLCQSDTDTDTTINVTSIQVTGTTTKILTLEQLFGIANRTASWTDIDTTYSNGTGLNLTGTTFYLDLNYADGVYVKRNTWTSIDNYPTGCSAGQFISTIGDSLTCSTPPDLNFNVSSVQFTGTTTKTLNLEQIGIANRTATFTDLTNSSADMINTINNTAGLYTFQGLNISTQNVNINAQNTTYTLGAGGIILNQSQSHFSIQQNSSGCVVIKGASSTLAVC